MSSLLVGKHLFAEPGVNVFAVLDGASIEDLLEMLDQHQPESICLYRGELEPDIEEVAPYLVRIEAGSAFTEWVLSRGWGNHWGIFAVSAADLTALRQHFRRFLTVHDSEGTPMLFRFYDPRVLCEFLPTCNSEELASFFGPVLSYKMESSAAEELIEFRLAQGTTLAHERVSLLQEV